MCVGMCVPPSMCGTQRTSYRNRFSPSTMCDLGIELGLSALAADAFIH